MVTDGVNFMLDFSSFGAGIFWAFEALTISIALSIPPIDVSINACQEDGGRALTGMISMPMT
jgi:hypothetical protein